jgi:precorrin-6Y C5,15-methyltransferase (decarboxylating)
MSLGQGTLTFEASQKVENAQVLIGAPRMLENAEFLYKNTAKRVFSGYKPKDVAEIIKRNEAESFAVLVSGDTGFYSAAEGILKALPGYCVKFIPGISTVNYFFAKLKLPWQNAAFVSAHGREANIADTVRRNRLVFCLTGNNAGEIGEALTEARFGYIKTFTGENLGTESERIREITASDLTGAVLPAMTVLLFENENPDERTPSGLADNLFIRRSGIPMTKSETRAQVLSKLNISPTDICYDIGAGTGSVTAEMALFAYRGHVYAVERREDAIALIKQNCASFHLGNVTAVCGDAPNVLETLPPPDTVFIGGSGGGLEGIINAVLRKKTNARIVLTAVTLETVSAALEAFKSASLVPEITQINTSRGKAVGNYHMLEAQNPVTIISNS